MSADQNTDAAAVAIELEQSAAMHRHEATFGQWLPVQPWMAISQLEARAAAVIRQQIARIRELEAAMLKHGHINIGTVLGYEAGVEEGKNRTAVLEGILKRFLDIHDEPCRYDHHGYCQEHFLEKDCTVGAARAVFPDEDEGNV